MRLPAGPMVRGRAAHRIATALTATLLAGLLAASLLLIGAGSAAAQSDAEATTTTLTDAGAPPPHIIPRPNSGTAPQSATDPGGWAQYAVMFAIVAGVGLIAFFVVRESRRKKPPQPTPPS